MGFSFYVAAAYFALFLSALLWSVSAKALSAARHRFKPTEASGEPEFPAPDVVITLVHGTWARRAPWTSAGSPLRQALSQAALGRVAFDRFAWSGSNSLAARRRAVQALVERLRASIARWPQARHYIVGHSHGGNIAFQALANPVLNERVAGLICLSTPFLHAAPRELGPVGHTALKWFPVAAIFYGGTLIVRVVAPTHAEAAAVWVLVLSAAVGFLIHRGMRRRPAAVPSSLEYPVVNPTKVLILRAAGDEASAALGAAHLVSWIAGRLWLATSRLLGEALDTIERWRATLMRHGAIAAGIAALAVVGVVAMLKLPKPPRWLESTSVTAVAVAFLMLALWARGGLVAAFVGRFLLAAMATPFLLAVALVGVAIGPELVIAGLLFQVTAETTPPGCWKVWQVTGGDEDADRGGGLMHSASYQNPLALRILHDWMLRTERDLQNSMM
jgi:hypothetical protein